MRNNSIRILLCISVSCVEMTFLIFILTFFSYSLDLLNAEGSHRRQMRYSDKQKIQFSSI